MTILINLPKIGALHHSIDLALIPVYLEASFISYLGYHLPDETSSTRLLPKCSSLQGTASTLLSCEHTFCEECMGDITGQTERLHLFVIVKCPFCSSDRMPSPRPLPRMAGYRILSRRVWGPMYSTFERNEIRKGR